MIAVGAAFVAVNYDDDDDVYRCGCDYIDRHGRQRYASGTKMHLRLLTVVVVVVAVAF